MNHHEQSGTMLISMNWLDRARREIPKTPKQGTANTADRNLTSVLAVPHLGVLEKIGLSNGSNGSTSLRRFQEFETGSRALGNIPRANSALDHVIHNFSKSLGHGTVITDVRNQPVKDRQKLYTRQNALFLRLNRRLDKFERFASEKEVMEALKAWADDGAIQDLYSGRRKWPEQRKLIYKWARMALKAIRRHRRFGELLER